LLGCGFIVLGWLVLGRATGGGRRSAAPKRLGYEQRSAENREPRIEDRG